jgi:hypothetical protein
MLTLATLELTANCREEIYPARSPAITQLRDFGIHSPFSERFSAYQFRGIESAPATGIFAGQPELRLKRRPDNPRCSDAYFRPNHPSSEGGLVVDRSELLGRLVRSVRTYSRCKVSRSYLTWLLACI